MDLVLLVANLVLLVISQILIVYLVLQASILITQLVSFAPITALSADQPPTAQPAT